MRAAFLLLVLVAAGAAAAWSPLDPIGSSVHGEGVEGDSLTKWRPPKFCGCGGRRA